MFTNYARRWQYLSIFFLCAHLVGASLPSAGLAAKMQVRIWEDSMTISTSVGGVPDPNPPFDLFNTGLL